MFLPSHNHWIEAFKIAPHYTVYFVCFRKSNSLFNVIYSRVQQPRVTHVWSKCLDLCSECWVSRGYDVLGWYYLQKMWTKDYNFAGRMDNEVCVEFAKNCSHNRILVFIFPCSIISIKSNYSSL